MADRLQEIMDWKRREIADRIRPVPPRELERLAGIGTSAVGFTQALRRAGGLAVIAEIKRRSPSAGAMAEGLDATEQARRYLNGGADALSVLTDEKFFGGNLRDLWEVTELIEVHARPTPCLRKDFMVHPVQVVEAAEAGARAILIIVRALSDDEMKTLREAADLAGLASIYEVHDEAETERALRFSPEILGINNRDLGRFVTDLGISERLLPQVPEGIVRVAESGIRDAGDAARLRRAGADAILVGETLMRAGEPENLIEEFRRIQ